jgi:2-phosphoglycolate phosphatase
MNAERTRLVIFDLDGTLVDAYQAVAVALNRSLKAFGYPPAEDEAIIRNVGWGEKYLIASFVRPCDVDAVQAFYREQHEKALPNGIKLLPGAQRLLADLKNKGYRLAVATNRPAWSTRIIMRCLGITSYFDCVLSSEQVPRAKPAPDILLEVIQRLEVPKAATLYVGDMTVDVETGQRAGIATVAVLTGSSGQDEIRMLGPMRIIDRIDQLLDILEERETVG